MKLLLVAATAAEIAPAVAFLKGSWQEESRNVFSRAGHEITVLFTGVGLMAATFSLTRALQGTPAFDLVLQAGIAGAYNQDIPLSSLVIVDTEALGDLGAEDHEAFLDIYQLGLAGKNNAPFSNGQLVNPIRQSQIFSELPCATGLTVHTGGGHAPTIDRRIAQYGADIETMEGAALHYVCLQLGVPFLQLRAISNYVTPRDRSAWQIGEAVKALNDALIESFGTISQHPAASPLS